MLDICEHPKRSRVKLILSQNTGCQIIYTYDFGDNWEHILIITGRSPPVNGNTFTCLDGTGHPIAEDGGSYKGWNELKLAYRTIDPNDDDHYLAESDQMGEKRR
ncbi:hypothetical protein F5Y16DRAFT_377638 [Xylariaceae sp. FL0255]|nr:hypothetical protein F5Y16DRAFT_377638 [Xylariaceae sp. FL0255]